MLSRSLSLFFSLSLSLSLSLSQSALPVPALYVEQVDASLPGLIHAPLLSALHPSAGRHVHRQVRERRRNPAHQSAQHQLGPGRRVASQQGRGHVVGGQPEAGLPPQQVRRRLLIGRDLIPPSISISGAKRVGRILLLARRVNSKLAHCQQSLKP